MNLNTILHDIKEQHRQGEGRSVWRYYNAAASAFAKLNGWRYYNADFRLTDLGTSRRRSEGRTDSWLDHSLHFKVGRINAAIAGQPYFGRKGAVLDELRMMIRDGFYAHVPPEPYASLWNPGACVFIVVTLSPLPVRWLAEQEAPLAVPPHLREFGDEILKIVKSQP
jgi:hypothetical protein